MPGGQSREKREPATLGGNECEVMAVVGVFKMKKK